MASRTKHQQRNHQQRRKCAFAPGVYAPRYVFISRVKAGLDDNGRQLYRSFTYRRPIVFNPQRTVERQHRRDTLREAQRG